MHNSMIDEHGVPRDITRNLTVVSRLLRNLFNQSIGDTSVTRSQWTLILVADRKPGSTQRYIAEILEVSEAAAGRLIDRLCADGLLERRPRSDDRRAYSVYLTDKAQPHLERLNKIAVRNEEIAFAGLSDAQMNQLNELLSLVYANLVNQKERPTA